MASWASILKTDKIKEPIIPDDCVQIDSINVKKHSKGKWQKVDASSLNFQLSERPIIVIQKKPVESSTDIPNQPIKRVIIVDNDGFISITRNK